MVFRRRCSCRMACCWRVSQGTAYLSSGLICCKCAPRAQAGTFLGPSRRPGSPLLHPQPRPVAGCLHG